MLRNQTLAPEGDTSQKSSWMRQTLGWEMARACFTSRRNRSITAVLCARSGRIVLMATRSRSSRVPRLVDFAHAAACDEAMNLKPAGDGGFPVQRFEVGSCGRRIGTRQKRRFEKAPGLLVGEQKHLHEMTNLRRIGAGDIEIGAAFLGGPSKSCLKKILDEASGSRPLFPSSPRQNAKRALGFMS